MKCYYYIQLANGGEIRLPANFVPITNEDNDLMNLIDSYEKSLTEGASEEKKEELKKYLKTKTKLNLNSIESVVVKYGKNFLEKKATSNDFIKAFNNKLDELSDVTDLYSIL
jgi:hypothetical protein